MFVHTNKGTYGIVDNFFISSEYGVRTTNINFPNHFSKEDKLNAFVIACRDIKLLDTMFPKIKG